MSTAKEHLELMKERTVDRYESVHQLGGINLRVTKIILDKQMDILGLGVDIGIRQMELLSVNDLQGLMGANVKLIKHFAEKLEDQKREILKLADEARDDYQDWYKNSMASMMTDKVSEKAA